MPMLNTPEAPAMDSEDLMKAVESGTRKAVTALAKSHTDLLFEAIRAGVADALWRVATNATSMPCHDFYDMIKDGVADGMARVNAEKDAHEG
jgi:hypothetical protein